MKWLRRQFVEFLSWYFSRCCKRVFARFNPTIICITGSVGKTTTKDVIATLLSGQKTVRATIRSQNSGLTTPMSIFSYSVPSKERRITVWLGHMFRITRDTLFLKEFPEVLVLEVGAALPGHITQQAEWLRPDIVIYTALADIPVHISNFNDDRDMLFQEKKQLALYSKESAFIVYPAGDHHLETLLSDVSRSKITVAGENDWQYKNVSLDKTGTRAQLYKNTDAVNYNFNATIPNVWGETYVQSLLLAVQVARLLDMDIQVTLEYFKKNFTAPAGRMRVLEGVNHSVVVDDAYNASPVAVGAALETLHTVSGFARKIFLFGDMGELGEKSHQAHVDVGKQVHRSCVDLFITVGNESKISAKTAVDLGMDRAKNRHFKTSNEAGQWLQTQLQENDLLLAKSSRHSIKMEQALRHIVIKQEQKHLVQEYL